MSTARFATEADERGRLDSMEYISYSQFSTYQCPRSWYLSKVRQGEERQTWYLPVGTVVHEAIEALINDEFFDLTNRFYDLVSMQMQIEPDLSKWLAAGPKDAPIKEEKALQRAVECFERAAQELDGLDVWEVEYDASGRLPGLDVPVRAYVDVVGEHKKKGPVIIDWKTGSTKPGNFQLETYGALLSHNGFGAPKELSPTDRWHGRYVMLAPGTPNTRYVDLGEVNPAEVGAKYQAVVDRMRAAEYAANEGFNCRFCLQQDNCLVNAGNTQRALYYDRSEEDGIPF